jgi:hypothetical protein
VHCLADGEAGFIKPPVPCLIELECPFTGDTHVERFEGCLDAFATDISRLIIRDATHVSAAAVAYQAARMRKTLIFGED